MNEAKHASALGTPQQPSLRTWRLARLQCLSTLNELREDSPMSLQKKKKKVECVFCRELLGTSSHGQKLRESQKVCHFQVHIVATITL